MEKTEYHVDIWQSNDGKWWCKVVDSNGYDVEGAKSSRSKLSVKHKANKLIKKNHKIKTRESHRFSYTVEV